jgi:beta-phosphoglucomutase
VRTDLILTDLDGTLVDTFKANFITYRDVLANYGFVLTEESYRKYFGLKIESMLDKIGFNVVPAHTIKEEKSKIYLQNLIHTRLNRPLLDILHCYKSRSIRIGLVSTASRINVQNVLSYYSLETFFDAIISGEDIANGKPSPEAYLKAMSLFNVRPENVTIFEDSEVGVIAARASGANYIQIKEFSDEI